MSGHRVDTGRLPHDERLNGMPRQRRCGPLVLDDGVVRDGLVQRIADVVRLVVDDEVVPRWRRLTRADISTKDAPDDMVTVVDRRTEDRLSERLTALLPGSSVVAEEAVQDGPGLLHRLSGSQPTWIIDPLDATRNYVAGRAEFATLVTLAHAGQMLASCTYLPIPGVLATAGRGIGAHVNGVRVTTRGPAEPVDGSRPLNVVTTDLRFARRAGSHPEEGMVAQPCLCTGLAYVQIARGDVDAALFDWPSLWDHAAGLLLVREAGGKDVTIEETSLELVPDNTVPFVVARDSRIAERILRSVRDQR